MKRGLEPDDPQLVDTARKVETLARRLLGQSVRQRELTAVINDMAQSGHPGAPQQTIESTPREIHQILADWRDAERRARDAAPGSPEAEALNAEIDRYREEYRAAHDTARRKR